MSQQQFKYSNSIIVYPLLFVFAIWVVFWYQIRFDSSIRHFGIHPQKIEGLLGIFTSPFLHSSLDHLYNNSIPLFILSMALFYFYKNIAWRVVLWGIVLSGLLTWCIGDSGNHIGASGLIYVLVSFMFFKGIFAKHYRLIALSLIIIFLYGSMIWYIFPVKDNMSWEGHLGGMLAGLLFAIVFRNKVAKPERYIWETDAYNEEDDLFMKHFDDDGNFIEFEPEPEPEPEPENDTEMRSENNVETTVNYVFKENSEKD